MVKLIERTAKNVHESVISLIAGNPKNILDVGCGTGAFLYKIYQIAPESILTGCDIEDQRSTFTKFNMEIINIDNGLCFKNESFNLITCIELIEHIENPFFLLRETYRVLKDNGQLIISSPNVENIFSRILYLLTGKFIHFFSKYDLDKKNHNHINPIFLWQWKILIEDMFDVEEITYNKGSIPFFNIPLWKNKLTGEVRILKLRKK